MESNKEDLRIRRTYKLLKDALSQLLTKKAFEKISVKDICDEAMVHRTTFYTHFEDKYDLLRYCMKELETPFEMVDIKSPTIDGYREYYITVAKSILAHVYENKDFYATLIKKNLEESFISNFEHELTNKILEKLKLCMQNGIKMPIPVEMLSSMYSSACMSAIKWWIENDIPFSAEKLLEYIEVMLMPIALENKTL